MAGHFHDLAELSALPRQDWFKGKFFVGEKVDATK